MNIGFSTGSLAKGDFRSALNQLAGTKANVVELSALRENELAYLISSLDELNLSQFKYVSFHAPSKVQFLSETALVRKLQIVKEKGFNIVLHPDIIKDIHCWRSLGPNLCIENMDKRKPIGRTSSDLKDVFYYLPESKLCFDIAHARQVDPTMTEAYLMIKNFGDRIAQIHMSDVNSQSIHEPLNFESILSYQKVARFLDQEIPIVMESPVSANRINIEMKIASFVFDKKSFENSLDSSGLTRSSYFLV